MTPWMFWFVLATDLACVVAGIIDGNLLAVIGWLDSMVFTTAAYTIFTAWTREGDDK